MIVLAITDIPRMTDLFERLASDRDDLVVASNIHRGVEELDRLKPELVIMQNHLSGLSADILLKHLKSRLGRRRCRFILISPSESLDVESSGKFDGIMDPTQSDEELCSILATFTLSDTWTGGDRTEQAGGEKPAGTPAGPLFQELSPEPEQLPAAEPPRPDAVPPQSSAEETPEQLPEPLTYDRPRRASRSVISAFSQQLDTNAEELPKPAAAPTPPPLIDYAQPFRLRDTPVITDIDEIQPWYRRGWVALLGLTICAAVAVTVYQQWKAGRTAPPRKPATPAVVAPPKPVAKPQQAPLSSTPQPQKPFAVHGTGRPKDLPSFVPHDGLDKGYGKEHAGWERYLGQAHEYRIFREKGGAIRSIQVLDKSGAGIQEPFYVTVLKEVAGAAAMRPVSSEIKEGYEIRKGEAGGLQVVQYRDAQGGRLRGIVIIWP